MLQLLVEKFTLVNWKTHQVRIPEAFEPGIPRHIPLNPCFFMPSSPLPPPPCSLPLASHKGPSSLPRGKGSV